MRVIVLPLGDVDAARVLERLPDAARIEWLNRTDFRRRPLATAARLLRQCVDEAVLVAPDLTSPRLRLTSLLLAVPRARRRRRIDLLGHDEAFSLSAHLRTNGFSIARHVLGCGLALLLAYPALGAFAWYLAREHGKNRKKPVGRPRRVLYLRSQLWLGLSGGGSVAHTAGVIGGLQQAGVEVVCVSSDALAGVSAPTCVVQPDCWFDGLGREAEDLVFNLPFTRAAWRSARARRPDVIYQRHTAFNASGAVLSRLLNIPLVLEFNSSEVWKGKHWGGLRLFRVARLVERINLGAANLVVVVSRALRDQLVADGLVESARVVVNPNAVDPARFRPDLAGTRIRTRLGLEWRTVVGFSGTFGVWHGIPSLAAVLPRVLNARPHVKFLLIGDGPLRGLIDQVVREHGLHDRVAMPGLVPLGDMPEYLAACDVLVSPHGRQVDGGEFFGSPTKVYEYMAAGRAIVASGVGQIAEALTDGQNALLIPPDDPEALVVAILRLVDDPCLRARLGAAARQRAEQHHTWRGNAERLLAALEGTSL